MVNYITLVNFYGPTGPMEQCCRKSETWVAQRTPHDLWLGGRTVVRLSSEWSVN